MMSKSHRSEVTPGGGIGVLGLLGVVFVTLKLTGVIDWSWWLVTLPFWGGLALFLVVAAFALLLYLLFSGNNKKRRYK